MKKGMSDRGATRGEICPINPSAAEIMGRKAYRASRGSGKIDVAVFAIPAKFVAQALIEVGRRRSGAVTIPRASGSAMSRPEEIRIRPQIWRAIDGSNIYGFTTRGRTSARPSALRFFDVKGHAPCHRNRAASAPASSAFSRSAKMGCHDRGPGQQSDIDEDDLLTFFEQDDHATIIAQIARL
jgi:acyl-CoA synthetase (NDP forming)